MYKIIDIPDEHNCTCVKQGRFPVVFPQLNEVSWSDVGVYRIGPIGTSPINIVKNTINGKVIQVGTYLVTCPSNVLQEK